MQGIEPCRRAFGVLAATLAVIPMLIWRQASNLLPLDYKTSPRPHVVRQIDVRQTGIGPV